MIIARKALNLIHSNIKPGKVIVLLGARRVGKTFLIKQYLESVDERYILWNGEDYAVHELLHRRSVQNYRNILGNPQLLIIDEAQKIPDIGLVLKLLVDSFEKLKIIVTGSSAFDITNLTGEPLTGRKYEIMMFPISENEFRQFEKPEERQDNLRQRLVYGNMPELINLPNLNDKAEYLRDMINSYLLKDILSFEKLKSSSKLFDLLKLIAFQVGNEVSLQEIGKQIGISKNTVERYLDLLSKVFIIYKVNGFSRNLRKEVVKNSKWYFYDNGVRNAIIANFNTLKMRYDIGTLWENYMMSERIKFHQHLGVISNRYFWRTYDQQEIDLVEERKGDLYAYEFKWKGTISKLPSAWKKTYPDASYNLITRENYFDWLSETA